MRSNGGIIGGKKTVSGGSASGIWAIRDAQREQGAGNWVSYFIEMYFWGGGGGQGAGGGQGGAGGHAYGKMLFYNSFPTFSLLIGGAGETMPPNSHGGGGTIGGGGAAAGIGYCGEGGGYTGLFSGASTFSHVAVALMAGGGGGGGYSGSGGGGGGTTGQNGFGSNSGGGGSQVGGGSGGLGYGPGSALQGGTSGSSGDAGGGAGGGGGYYGGGAGWNGDDPAGNSGGGGGSGFINTSIILDGVLTGASADVPGNTNSPYRTNNAGQKTYGGQAVFVYSSHLSMSHASLTGSTATDGSFKVTTITAGSGNVSWA